MEEVLALVERIPPGRVMSYGAIADHLAERSGRSSPRLVGTIMAKYGGAVPWHRVVSATGRLPPGHEQEARARLQSEGLIFPGPNLPHPLPSWTPPHPSSGG